MAARVLLIGTPGLKSGCHGVLSVTEHHLLNFFFFSKLFHEKHRLGRKEKE